MLIFFAPRTASTTSKSTSQNHQFLNELHRKYTKTDENYTKTSPNYSKNTSRPPPNPTKNFRNFRFFCSQNRLWRLHHHPWPARGAVSRLPHPSPRPAAKTSISQNCRQNNLWRSDITPIDVTFCALSIYESTILSMLQKPECFKYFGKTTKSRRRQRQRRRKNAL